MVKTEDNRDFKSWGKILKLSCGFSANLQYSYKEPSPEDRISQLPDETLLLILSLLTSEEALKTSVLSKRWMTLYMHTSRLDFNANKSFAFDRMIDNIVVVKTETRKFVNRINRVLYLHESPELDEFIVSFDLDETFQNEIDKWIDFAFAKKVRRLELDFVMFTKQRQLPLKSNPFNNWFIYPICENFYPAEFGRVHLEYSCIDVKSFKELILKNIDVTDEVIKLLLLKCPFLEQLTVLGSPNLFNVEVSDPLLRLKYLEITDCFKIESVTISCPNLKTLKLSGLGKLMLTNIPMLTEVHVYEVSGKLSNFVFSELSCCLSQLEILMLHSMWQPSQKILMPPGFPELSKLNELIINFGAWDDTSLIELTSFITACPNLQKFVLQLIWIQPTRTRREHKKALVKCPLKYLKVVEVLGYYGRTSEDELIIYFIENAVALEKITVNPGYNTFLGGSQFHDAEGEKTARICAKQQLQKLVPKHVELKIL